MYGMYLCARASRRAFADDAHYLAHDVAVLHYPGASQVAGEAHDAALQVSTRVDAPPSDSLVRHEADMPSRDV